MIAIVPFEPAHMAKLTLRAAQRGEAERFGFAPAAAAELGPAYTAVEQAEDGAIARILGCAGLAENLPLSHPGGGYATAWAAFADDLRPAEWSALTAIFRSVLDGCGYARVDMAVRAGFDAAHRYALHLGFERDSVIYARRGEPLLPVGGEN